MVAAFNLAVDGRGNRLWIDVEAWGHLAGTVATYLTARRHVAVTGRLAKKQYLRDGRKQIHVVVIADRIVFLDAPTPGGATEPNGAASTERAGGRRHAAPNRLPMNAAAITVLWAAKGGSGTTTVAAALAILNPHHTLLVDLDGELPAAAGLPDPPGDGVADWLRSDEPSGALFDLTTTVNETTRLLPRGTPPGRPSQPPVGGVR